MVIFGDYHTHTFYSDGKQSVLQSAQVAKQKGLKEIAITDHGFNKFKGLKRKKLDDLRKECKQAETQTGIKILLGVEANIISKNGDIDVTENDLQKIDILVVGFHQIVKGKTFLDRLRFIIPNNLNSKSKKTIERNTKAVIGAIQKYPIDILSHPGVGCPIDIKKVGEVAKQHGTKMEINGKRIAYTEDDIKYLIENKVEFVLSSDAHSAKRIGECDKGINFVIKNKVPFSLIANYGKRPNFRFCKGDKNWVFQNM